jgi:general secretion pathway protein H
MDKRGVPVQRPTLPACLDEMIRGEEGFTLLELICVMAILSLLAAIVVPTFPLGTSKAHLASYAVATASLLKADRNAALRRRLPIVTEVNAQSRLVRSGGSGRVVRVPDDVTFDALLAARCNDVKAGSTIQFFPSGMSCGGVITLSRSRVSYEVRVNWLTGGVEVVEINT